MKPLLRIPALVWIGADDAATAISACNVRCVGRGASTDHALRDLRREFEAAMMKELPTRVIESPEITSIAATWDPPLTMEKVELTGQGPISVRLDAVVGAVAGPHDWEAVVPTLGISASGSDRRDCLLRLTRAAMACLYRFTLQEVLSRFPEGKGELAILRVPAVPKEDVSDDPDAIAELFGAVPLHRASRKTKPAPAFGLNSAVQRVAEALRHEATAVLLVGPRGVGKSTVLAAAARKPGQSGRARGARIVPIYAISTARMLGSIYGLGTERARLQSLCRAVGHKSGWIAVDRAIDLLLPDAGEPKESLAHQLSCAAETHGVKIIAEATREELAVLRSHQPEFVARCDIIELQRLSPEEARDALLKAASQRLKGPLSSEAINALDWLLRLQQRFESDAAQPTHAIAFLSHTLSEWGEQALTRDAITAEFIARSGIPEVLLDPRVRLDEDAVRKRLEAEVLAQPQATEAALEILSLIKADMVDPVRPLSVQLWLGPTGVGKTSMARALARELFGQTRDPEAALIRFDMSEYGLPGAVERWVGAGLQSVGLLTKRLTAKPYAVLLLDEIEKAHPSIFDLLLGVLDEGRMTTPEGRVLSFRSTVIVMTSNLGTGASTVGFGGRSVDVLGAAAEFFRPEFLGRIDRVVSFHPLGETAIRSIAARELSRLAQRAGIATKGIALTTTEALLAYVARAGFHPTYGARPLQRVIESEVASALARYLLTTAGAAEGALTIDVDATGAIIVRPT